MNGIINIYKEKGFTSHDVVAKLRGILRQRKIGHTGTLDPDAEGVLPVCLGKATKLCDFLTDKEKEYRSVLHLGIDTDTQDITGAVLEKRSVDISEEEIKQVIMSFIGSYDQIPPMYSAIKVNGKKLYELAREGKTIERQPRPVTIHNIVIEEISLPFITMRVKCSKGTYIRTLCHDIGEKAGCLGCMESLVRTQSGNFKIEGSLKLSQVESLRDEGTLEEYIQSIDSIFTEYPRATVRPEFEKMLHNGNAMYLEQLASECEEDVLKEQEIRIYDTSDIFIGIYRYNSKSRQFQPVKVFLGGE